MQNVRATSIIEGMTMLNELLGYDIAELPPKAVIRMMTSEGPCTLVIVEPKDSRVVIARQPAERFGRPVFATLRGASLQGHLKVNWIPEGGVVEFDLDNAGRLSVEVVSMFPPEESPDEADIFIGAAKRE